MGLACAKGQAPSREPRKQQQQPRKQQPRRRSRRLSRRASRRGKVASAAPSKQLAAIVRLDSEFEEDSEDELEGVSVVEAAQVCAALDSLDVCLRTLLEKNELEACAPALAMAGVRRLDSLRGKGSAEIEQMGGPHAHALMCALGKPNKSQPAAWYLDLLNDSAWLDQCGVGLRVVKPARHRGKLFKLPGNTPRAYQKPPVEEDKVAPQEFAQRVPLSSFSRVLKDTGLSASSPDYCDKHFVLGVTEQLHFQEWSKARLRLENPGLSCPMKVYVRLGDSLFARTLAPGESVELGVGDKSRACPVAVEVGPLLLALCGTRQTYPEGPSHAGDGETLMVYSTDEAAERSKLLESGQFEHVWDRPSM